MHMAASGLTARIYDDLVDWADKNAEKFVGSDRGGGQLPDAWLGVWRVTVGGRDYCAAATHVLHSWLIRHGVEPYSALRALGQADLILRPSTPCPQGLVWSHPVQRGGLTIWSVLILWPPT